MPSFSTVNGSYNQFFVSIIDNAPYISSNKNKHTLCRFLLLSLIISIFTILLMSIFYGLIYFDFHQHQIWENHKLYWFYDGFVYFGTAFVTFIITSLLLESVINTPILYYLTICHRKFIIILISFLLIVSSIYLIVVYIFWYIFPDGSSKSVFNESSFICDVILCSFWTQLHLLNHVIFVGCFPIFFFILWLFVSWLCSISEKRKTYDQMNHNNDLELSLLQNAGNLYRESSNDSIIECNKSLNMNLFERISNKAGIKYCLLFGLVFGILWILRIFFVRIETNILKNGTDFEYLYYYLLIYTSFFKFILKKIGRRIDEERIKNNELNGVLSMEFYFEWYLSIVYFSWFRINIVYNLPPLNLFILIFFVHLSSELIQSLTKFSSLYYRLSQYILNYLKDKSEHNKFYYIIFKIFEDDSDINEWRNRNGLDMILRLYASLLIAIIQAYLMIIIGSKGFSTQYQLNTYYKGIYYGTLIIIGEMIYYIFLWIYRWYITKYDIFSPFVWYIMGMNHAQQSLLFLAFVGVIIPTMLQ